MNSCGKSCLLMQQIEKKNGEYEILYDDEMTDERMRHMMMMREDDEESLSGYT